MGKYAGSSAASRNRSGSREHAPAIELLIGGLCAFSLILSVLIRSASAASAGTPPEWRSLVGPANDVAAAVAGGKPRPVVTNAMQALDNAQHALPPDVPRPISCWDMM